MTTEDRGTPEERAYGRLVGEAREVLSAEAGSILTEAEGVAYAEHLIRTFEMAPEEYDGATERMSLAAAGLTDREHELLARLWRAALSAAASIDPFDGTPVPYYKACRGDFHGYYRMLSGLVEGVLRERQIEKLHEGADRDAAGLPDARF